MIIPVDARCLSCDRVSIKRVREEDTDRVTNHGCRACGTTTPHEPIAILSGLI